jgi:hypothetical protein
MAYNPESYERNKDVIKVVKKRYYQKNKGAIREKQKEYDDAHRDKINERARARYHARKQQSDN